MCTVDVYTSKSYMVHEYCVRVINNITLPGELVYTCTQNQSYHPIIFSRNLTQKGTFPAFFSPRRRILSSEPLNNGLRTQVPSDLSIRYPRLQPQE